MKRDIISLARRIRIIFQAYWILLQASYYPFLAILAVSNSIFRKSEKEDINVLVILRLSNISIHFDTTAIHLLTAL